MEQTPEVAAMVEEIKQRRRQFKDRGICPSCEGIKQLRATRFPDGTLESKVKSLVPCYLCGGTGEYTGQEDFID